LPRRGRAARAAREEPDGEPGSITLTRHLGGVEEEAERRGTSGTPLVPQSEAGNGLAWIPAGPITIKLRVSLAQIGRRGKITGVALSAGVSRRSVCDALNELWMLGWLEFTARGGDGITWGLTVPPRLSL
jgi:hypothetical protein